MRPIHALLAGLACSLTVTSASLADGAFADKMNDCIDKFVKSNNAAKVVLDCVAKDGKVSDCKVVENSAPAQDFDKAAMCVASSLPMGAKTGPVRLPIMFPERE